MKLEEASLNQFKESVNKYLEIFNLNNWKVYVVFTKLEGAYARAVMDYQTHTATIECSNEIPDGVMPDIDMLACHECLEIILQPLREIFLNRQCDIALFDIEAHAIIRILEKTYQLK